MAVRLNLVLLVTVLLFSFLKVANAATNENLEIVNKSSKVIWHVKVSQRGIDFWSKDKLNGVLMPGESTTFNFNDGTSNCLYDLIASTEGNKLVWDKRNIDVCESKKWTLGD